MEQQAEAAYSRAHIDGETYTARSPEEAITQCSELSSMGHELALILFQASQAGRAIREELAAQETETGMADDLPLADAAAGSAQDTAAITTDKVVYRSVWGEPKTKAAESKTAAGTADIPALSSVAVEGGELHQPAVYAKVEIAEPSNKSALQPAVEKQQPAPVPAEKIQATGEGMVESPTQQMIVETFNTLPVTEVVPKPIIAEVTDRQAPAIEFLKTEVADIELLATEPFTVDLPLPVEAPKLVADTIELAGLQTVEVQSQPELQALKAQPEILAPETSDELKIVVDAEPAVMTAEFVHRLEHSVAPKKTETLPVVEQQLEVVSEQFAPEVIVEPGLISQPEAKQQLVVETATRLTDLVEEIPDKEIAKKHELVDKILVVLKEVQQLVEAEASEPPKNLKLEIAEPKQQLLETVSQLLESVGLDYSSTEVEEFMKALIVLKTEESTTKEAEEAYNYAFSNYGTHEGVRMFLTGLRRFQNVASPLSATVGKIALFSSQSWSSAVAA